MVIFFGSYPFTEITEMLVCNGEVQRTMQKQQQLMKNRKIGNDTILDQKDENRNH